MRLIRVHDNWPDWFTEYVEKKIAESGTGKFSIEVPSHRPVYGKKLGKALALGRDNILFQQLSH